MMSAIRSPATDLSENGSRGRQRLSPRLCRLEGPGGSEIFTGAMANPG
jgi:hypothetical protein